MISYFGMMFRKHIWIVIASISLLFVMCIRDIEDEGVFMDCAIQGMVLESEDKQPVANISLVLVIAGDTIGETRSEQDGHFKFVLSQKQLASRDISIIVCEIQSDFAIKEQVKKSVHIDKFGRKEYDAGSIYIHKLVMEDVSLTMDTTCTILFSPEVYRENCLSFNWWRNDTSHYYLISPTAALFSAAVKSSVYNMISSMGFVWGTSSMPTLIDNHAGIVYAEKNEYKDISGAIDFLEYGEYYIRAFTTIANETIYSEQQHIIVPFGIAPIIESVDTFNIRVRQNDTTGTFDIWLEFHWYEFCGCDGGFEVLDYGYLYDTVPIPSSTMSMVSCKRDDRYLYDEYSRIKDVLLNKRYYFRVYARNIRGTMYGEEKSIMVMPKPIY